MQGEKSQRVVAPVVAQTLPGQVPVIQIVMHGHQLQGRDAEVLKVRNHRGRSDAGVGTPQRRRNVRVQHGHAADVGFVDDRLVPRVGGPLLAAPVEARIDDRAERRKRRAVALVERQIAVGVADLVAEQFVGPRERAADGLGIRVQQQLVGVEAQALGRFVRAIDSVAIELTGAQARHVRMPDAAGALAQPHPRRLALGLRIEQAEFHRLGAR